jgi:hypothetical protein
MGSCEDMRFAHSTAANLREILSPGGRGLVEDVWSAPTDCHISHARASNMRSAVRGQSTDRPVQQTEIPLRRSHVHRAIPARRDVRSALHAASAAGPQVQAAYAMDMFWHKLQPGGYTHMLLGGETAFRCSPLIKPN